MERKKQCACRNSQENVGKYDVCTSSFQTCDKIMQGNTIECYSNDISTLDFDLTKHEQRSHFFPFSFFFFNREFLFKHSKWNTDTDFQTIKKSNIVFSVIINHSSIASQSINRSNAIHSKCINEPIAKRLRA